MSSKRVSYVRNIPIGGGNPILVQSMFDKPLLSVEKDEIVKRIYKLKTLGLDIFRFSYISEEEGETFSYITSHSPLPIVADIHFDYKMAISALEHGADKVRINPGNIGAKWKTEEVVRAAKDHNACIRIGLNSGSLPKSYNEKDKALIMVNSALEYLEDFEKLNFYNTVVSLKSSNPEETIRANILFSEKSDYPIHLGVTEAGGLIESTVRSVWALSKLLEKNIGDTLRISINDSLESEVEVGCELLRTLGLKKKKVNLISCPKCGRCVFDSFSFLNSIRPKLQEINKELSVAVMGCSVNGLGESHSADYAVTGNGEKIFVYAHGIKIGETKDENTAEKLLMDLIENDR